MKLSVIVPVLNEITFIPLYIESASRYADEIIIADGGSTDGTIEEIERLQQRYAIRLFHVRQSGLPYTEDWNESVVRNFLIDQAQGDWIMNLDVDEMMDDRFAEVLPELLNRQDVDIYQFPFVNFWGDPWTIRMNSPGDERWSNDITRMWRAGQGIRYRDEKHHCTLEAAEGRSIWSIPRGRSDVNVYHYHYALGNKIKFNDNRRGDVNVQTSAGQPDWSFKPEGYDIVTKPYEGQHPEVIRSYLIRQEGSATSE
ncbi:glycosyltransferase [Paenibacillus lautus]|jgi:glycosyltransferase involved in cell wall biosynthesis|uniref:Glycosyltransferase n=1 Tax=Paenibacillus lautus TaxID=1401 RepID=A0A385TJ38_PAELA|nr:glycosyltransferase [Paenibacillus lautus]AYB44520.1 glycosyltransferase [Paenibacillus lautus]MCI1776806.1 glycosyltransferase [Paenibacillus lautus]